ncbi:MAG TPA: hypothetical protein VGQ60_00085 [Nitrospiraceae bacterium]|jgi:hypothetical protein|nr:hypothetical protein [Nitrospiraceae bacterium]
MKYVLAAIAGIWMADGLALLVAPRFVIMRVRDVLALTPAMLRWEGLAVLLGVLLLLGAKGLHYQPLWMVMGAAMIAKGLFLATGPERWRKGVLEWCLQREDVDYRFWGLGLCALALLLLHALGWLRSG